jgi:hypothetical protein
MIKKVIYLPIIISMLFLSCQVDEGQGHSHDNSLNSRKIEYLKGKDAEKAKTKIDGKISKTSLKSRNNSQITTSYDEILLITDS